MKYTPEQLKELSNSEINLAVAHRRFTNYEDISESGNNLDSVVITRQVGGKYSLEEYNPCHDWNDTIELAKDKKMIINFKIEQVWAFKPVNGRNGMQRAICEMFLLLDQ